MIMVGGGARHAAAEVRALAERLQAPVVPFRGGRGIVGDDHPLGFTCVSGFERWAETDVVIGIGSRMELSWFRWPEKPAGLKTILLDIDPRQATRLERGRRDRRRRRRRHGGAHREPPVHKGRTGPRSSPR